MKGFIISLLLFFFIIVGLLIYSHYMKTTVSELLAMLDETETEIDAGDSASAFQSASSFDTHLKAKSHHLYPVCDRALLENALSDSAQMQSFIRSGDMPDAASVLAALRSLLISIAEKSRFSLLNIV